MITLLRSIRIANLNKPTSFLRAAIGRELNLEPPFIALSRLTELTTEEVLAPSSSCSSPVFQDGLYAALFSRQRRSYLSLRLHRDDMHKDFQLSFKIRTYDQDGLIFASIVSQSIFSNLKNTLELKLLLLVQKNTILFF